MRAKRLMILIVPMIFVGGCGQTIRQQADQALIAYDGTLQMAITLYQTNVIDKDTMRDIEAPLRAFGVAVWEMDAIATECDESPPCDENNFEVFLRVYEMAKKEVLLIIAKSQEGGEP